MPASALASVAPRRSIGLALLGLAFGVAGVVGYAVVLRFGGRFPSVRNDAVPNWCAIAVGLVLSVAAIARASRGRRLVSAILLVVNGAIAAWFAAVLYVVTALPEAHGPAIGASAPDFALPDQSGRGVRLADFRGKPLLIVFYRGHW